MHDVNSLKTILTSAIAIVTTTAISMPLCAQEESNPEFGESFDIIQRAVEMHATMPGGRVVISTTIFSKDSEIKAPPTRGAFGFLRETSEKPAHIRSECWSGPEGGLDLISDGTTLFIGDPVRRTYRTRSAPATIGAYVQEQETASLLGVGPGLLMSWLDKGGVVFEPNSKPQRTLVKDRAAYAIQGCAPSPVGEVTVEFSFAAGDQPLLLGARLPMPDGSVVEISYSEWEPQISEQPFFASAFKINLRPNWTYNQNTGVFGAKPASAQRTNAPAQALIGNPAPNIAMLQDEDSAGSNFEMKDNLSIVLFWSNTEAVGREALFAIEEAANALQENGAEVVAVQLGDGVASAGANNSITHVQGDAEAIYSAWQLSGVPTIAVIDPNGVVRAIQVGYPGKEMLTQRLLSASKKLASKYAAVSE